MYQEADVRIRWGIRIPMRDGIQLVGDLYLPAAGAGASPGAGESAGSVTDADGPWPAIVVRTPYGRATDAMIEQGSWFAARGYAVVQVDVRGRGDSEGVFVPYRNEGRDGYDVIEWVAAQPWCTGAVGTLGASYLGRIQWLTALHHPPHLKAMISLVTPSDPFVEWPTGIPSPMHLCWLFMTADRVMQNVRQIDWRRVYEHLPLVTMDEAVGRPLPAWREEFEHPLLDDWWRELCYQDKFHEIDIPVLHISGWYDDEQIGTPLNFAGMTRHAPSEWVRRAQRLIMGPWPHQVNTSTKLGEVDFGPSALIDLRARELQFFDRWLKGERNGEDEAPPVSIFVMGVNEWRSEQEWPLARIRYTPWYLHSGGRANSLLGDGVLSPEAPGDSGTADGRGIKHVTVREASGAAAVKGQAECSAGLPEAASDTYVYDPRRPVPFITEPTSSQIGGPDDYTPVHRRDDVLVYTSEPLTEPLEVIGPVRMRLFASTTAPDTDFIVQLHDVWPNGYAQRLCDGMVRARFRNGMDRPELVEPGAVIEYDIDCWNTCHVFLPGHRIRIHITSSAFPKYDRNPNTGEPLGLSERMETAVQTVYHSAAYPSAIVLPVIPRQ